MAHRPATARRLVQTVLILLVVCGATLIGAPARPAKAQTPPTPLDLMLVLDGSGSIAPPDFELARRFARTVINSCLFVPGSRAGVVEYSTTARLVQGLSGDRGEVDLALRALIQSGGSTATGSAINLAQSHLTSNQRQGAKNVIIVLTDGESNTGPSPIAAANDARAAGSKLFAIGVGRLINRAELEGIADQPSASHVFEVTDFASLQAALAPVVGAACGVPVVPIEEEESPAADIWVVQRLSPNHGVIPGSIITVQVVTTNMGKGAAKNTRITMPFDPAKVRLIDASFSKEAAWVSSVVTNSLTINTGPVGVNEVITGTVRFQVFETLARDVALGERLSFVWIDNAGSGRGKSNLPVLVTAAATDNRSIYALAVNPSRGPAGSRFTFSSAIFASNEAVSAWYNLPDASARAVGSFAADDDGKVNLVFDAPATLAPGVYSMVIYGHRTGFAAVALFTVSP